MTIQNKKHYLFDSEPKKPETIYDGLAEFDAMLNKLLTRVLLALIIGVVAILSYHYIPLI